MIALLGSALRFGTSFLPQVLSFFQKKQDHKNRLEELKLQGELAKMGLRDWSGATPDQEEQRLAAPASHRMALNETGAFGGGHRRLGCP